MTTTEVRNQSRLAKVGWVILLVISALLLLAGINWFIGLPDLALANIAERTSLAPSGFQQGNPSAFDVITLIARQFGIGYAALGLLALIVAWQGYRHGSRWTWTAMWVLVAAIAAVAVSFMLAGGVSAAALTYLAVAAVALVGQLLARKGLSPKANERVEAPNAL